MTGPPSPAVPAGGGEVVVVSPHYDDVPLSLGQSLRDGVLSGAAVTVRVVFGRTNWTTRLHPTRGRAPLVTAWRRAEEAAAARCFGYRVHAERLEEVILRTGSADVTDYLGGGDPHADPLFPQVRRLLATWLERSPAVWVPAGLGGHLDHRIVAWAAADLVRHGATGVAFYEDRPYAGHLGDREVADQLSELGLDLEARDVSGPIRGRTQSAVRRCYPSQMSEYFLEAQRRDRESGRVERVWLPVTAGPRARSR